MKKNLITLLVLMFLCSCNSKITMKPNQQDSLEFSKSASGDENEYTGKTAKEQLNNARRQNETIEQYFTQIKFAASPTISIRYCNKILSLDPANKAAFYERGKSYSHAAILEARTDTEKKEYIKKAEKDFKMAKKLGYKSEEETK
ncbi:MAG: hypothetical protein ABIC68_06740 [Candidatus Omnitrophota bacterium]